MFDAYLGSGPELSVRYNVLQNGEPSDPAVIARKMQEQDKRMRQTSAIKTTFSMDGVLVDDTVGSER
jgi:hypothetical protein